MYIDFLDFQSEEEEGDLICFCDFCRENECWILIDVYIYFHINLKIHSNVEKETN